MKLIKIVAKCQNVTQNDENGHKNVAELPEYSRNMMKLHLDPRMQYKSNKNSSRIFELLFTNIVENTLLK